MDKINKAYDYLLLIAMIYIAIDLSSMVFAYKFIEIGPIIGAASSLIFPLTYSTMDIIAEVFGYRTAKKIICYACACDFLFAILVLAISNIPSINQSETAVYIQILSPLLRAVIAQTIGVLSGAFINIHLISKWKIMTNGRYFWLRSIGSSTIGEAAMLVISTLIGLLGVLSISKILQLIMYAYIYKIIFAIIIAPFISIIAYLLKTTISDQHLNLINYNFLSILNKEDFYPNIQKS
ncbi:MAG: queuosine precursor transporter [Gammaproteobacteria bacterium]|nr:queuosine precursor transporter [Gammaproteobacteria bacterium]